MFNTEKIEALERRIEYLEEKETQLKKDLKERRIFTKDGMYYPVQGIEIPCVASISLEELQTMQRKIIDFIGVELKTTEAKTELVKKSGN